MTAAMFEATIHGLRTVPTRKMVQIIIEAPIEHLSHIARVAEHGAWVCVARLTPEAKEETTEDSFAETRPRPSLPPQAGGANKKWDEMRPAQQAGILCDDPAFRAFLKQTERDAWEISHGDPPSIVRYLCDVESRKDIRPGTRSAKLWTDLVGFYRAWQREPEVVG